jgi:hypothetical protein
MSVIMLALSKGLTTYTSIVTSVFARTDYHGPALTKLTDIIDYVKPTALLGLSTLRVWYLSMTLPLPNYSTRVRMRSVRKW